jgi:hypothetical protein
VSGSRRDDDLAGAKMFWTSVADIDPAELINPLQRPA